MLCGTLPAHPSYFEAHYLYFKIILCGDLPLQALEGRTVKLFNFPAMEARQVQMVLLCFDLVVVLFPIQVHQVKFINQPQLFQEFESSVHGRTIDLAISFPGQRQQGGRIQMAVGFLNGFEQYSSLPGDADAPQSQFLKQ